MGNAPVKILVLHLVPYGCKFLTFCPCTHINGVYFIYGTAITSRFPVGQRLRRGALSPRYGGLRRDVDPPLAVRCNKFTQAASL